jgi:hypothetical protein
MRIWARARRVLEDAWRRCALLRLRLGRWIDSQFRTGRQLADAGAEASSADGRSRSTLPSSGTPGANGERHAATNETAEIVGSPPMPLSPGKLVAGKYRIGRLLGRGDAGYTVLANQVALEQPVVLKFMHAWSANENPEEAARFLDQARAAARIRSDHVVRVSDTGALEDGAPYIVMEYLEGQGLDALLQERRPLPVAHAVAYAMQAIEGLGEAHAAGLVHRDLKPTNLLLTQRTDGSVGIKVLGFGVSRVPSGPVVSTNNGDKSGWSCYMAPEQVTGARDVDQRVDIWALGAVLYEMLAANPPFVGETADATGAQILHTLPKPLRYLRADVPPVLEAAVMQCLEKLPGRRFQNMGALARALASFEEPNGQAAAARVERIAPGPEGEIQDRARQGTLRVDAHATAARIARKRDGSQDRPRQGTLRIDGPGTSRIDGPDGQAAAARIARDGAIQDWARHGTLRMEALQTLQTSPIEGLDGQAAPSHVERVAHEGEIQERPRQGTLRIQGAQTPLTPNSIDNRPAPVNPIADIMATFRAVDDREARRAPLPTIWTLTKYAQAFAVPFLRTSLFRRVPAKVVATLGVLAVGSAVVVVVVVIARTTAADARGLPFAPGIAMGAAPNAMVTPAATSTAFTIPTASAIDPPMAEPPSPTALPPSEVTTGSTSPKPGSAAAPRATPVPVGPARLGDRERCAKCSRRSSVRATDPLFGI